MNDNLTRADRHATEQANEMSRKLEHSAPAQLIASEYQCWLEEEQRLDRWIDAAGARLGLR